MVARSAGCGCEATDGGSMIKKKKKHETRIARTKFVQRGMRLRSNWQRVNDKKKEKARNAHSTDKVRAARVAVAKQLAADQ